MKKQSDHPVISETNYGLKGSALSFRPSKTNPSARFALYIPKEEDATSIRIPFLIILLGLILTTANSLPADSSDRFFFFFQIIEQGGLISLPLLSLLALISTIILENLASFQLANIVGSWFISGFLIGLVYGRTNYEGILVLTLKALVYLFTFLFMFSISFYYYLINAGNQTGTFINLDLIIIMPFLLLIFLFLLVPLSLIASLGHYIGVKLNNE